MTSNKVAWHLKHAEHGNKPWAVQAEALRRSKGKSRYAWFLEQGLGKTSLALNDYYDHYLRGEVDLMVVVCPNSFKSDWALAPAEWGIPQVPGSWHPKAKIEQLTGRGPGVIAVNFEAVRSGAGTALGALARRSKLYLALDESLALGTPSSDTTKACIQLARQCAVVRLLNGTPTAKDVTHYYGQLKALNELDGLNQYGFRNRFAIMGGFKGKQVTGIRNEEELARILARCSFRALKADWRKDLPPQVFTPVHLEMTPTQRHHYQEMALEFLTIYGDGLNVVAPMVLTQMEKLRQIATGLLMQDGEHAWIMKPALNPKLKATTTLLGSGPTKAIVTYQYRPTGDMLMSALEDAGYEPATIRGELDPKELADHKERFNKDPKCRVIACQTAASFRGHTLIGGKGEDRCNRMIFFENSFSWYQRVQMQDRIHRGAQDQECHYYDLITSPIEQVLVNALKSRKDFADAMDQIAKAAAGD